MSVMQSNPYLYACHLGALAGCELLSLLPESDIVEDLKNVYLIQLQIMNSLEVGMEFDAESLVNYQEYALDMIRQVTNIKSNSL